MVTERNKFDTLQETAERHSLNDGFEKFITTHIEAATKCIPAKTRAKCRLSWVSLVVKEKQDNIGKKHPYLMKETQLTMHNK